MTFAYNLVSNRDEPMVYSTLVEVKAVWEKPKQQAEEVFLVAANTTKRTGPFTISFSLDAAELALSTKTTITANAYTTIEAAGVVGPIFESFTQSLAIQSKDPLLEVDKNLVRSWHKDNFPVNTILFPQ